MTTPRLIGLCGASGAGKDTAAAYLEQRYGFARFAFADPVRDAALVILQHAGVSEEWLTARELKERPIPGLGWSARQLLQHLGTEGVRSLDANAWIRILQLRAGLGELDTPVADRIVISDVRFANEVAWLIDRGGMLLRIVRDDASTSTSTSHVSELGWREMVAFDVANTGSVEWLHTRLDGVMRGLGIDEVCDEA